MVNRTKDCKECSLSAIIRTQRSINSINYKVEDKWREKNGRIYRKFVVFLDEVALIRYKHRCERNIHREKEIGKENIIDRFKRRITYEKDTYEFRAATWWHVG